MVALLAAGEGEEAWEGGCTVVPRETVVALLEETPVDLTADVLAAAIEDILVVSASKVCPALALALGVD